ncbi:hypothetical protein [Circoviridae sp.]|nr:hypothetical protein [Circoviridae sp.]
MENSHQTKPNQISTVQPNIAQYSQWDAHAQPTGTFSDIAKIFRLRRAWRHRPASGGLPQAHWELHKSKCTKVT